MTQQDGQDFVEIQEAAKSLGISRKTLERHAEKRGIQKFQRGLRNQVFFRKEDIESLKDWLYTIKPTQESDNQ